MTSAGIRNTYATFHPTLLAWIKATSSKAALNSPSPFGYYTRHLINFISLQLAKFPTCLLRTTSPILDIIFLNFPFGRTFIKTIPRHTKLNNIVGVDLEKYSLVTGMSSEMTSIAVIAMYHCRRMASLIYVFSPISILLN